MDGRDFAAELRVMPASRLLIILAYKADFGAWLGGGQPITTRLGVYLHPAAVRLAHEALKAEIDRRFPVPA